ncbi:MAG: dienelactone hydrolase family protein [Candidatus Obscuribacterales bacterium]|nr:dienelactone hydrolase family protein [Candidatus Obscuribacterales bacterium]
MKRIAVWFMVLVVFLAAGVAPADARSFKADRAQKAQIAGLDVAIWEPENASGPMPLVIYSHGFRTTGTISSALLKDLADAGYLVIAPTHQDSFKKGIHKKQENFMRIDKWNDSTYRDRGEDIKNLIAALRQDPRWNSRIDWSKVALAGCSLGGYTVLGLAGAWSSWKIPQPKAVIALSPYCHPYILRETLGNITVPIMYQGGTKDKWITPFVKKSGGAFSQSHSPAIFVEFKNANHFAWSNVNRDEDQKKLMSHYCVEFLNKYLMARPDAKPEVKLAGITTLEVK